MKNIAEIINKFKVEKWLPEPVKEILEKHLSNLKTYCNSDIKVFKTVYSKYYDDFEGKDLEAAEKHRRYLLELRAQGFIYFRILFQDPIMEDVWNSLLKKNKEETLKLVTYFLEWYFYINVKGAHRDDNEDHANHLKERRKMVNNLHEGMVSMGKLLNYRCSYYIGYFPLELDTGKPPLRYQLPHEIHDEFLESYEEFMSYLTRLHKILNSEEYDNYIYLQHPDSRKKNVEDYDAMMFMRELYIRIRDKFKSPMNRELAEIVNLLFETELTENHIVKYTQKIREKDIKGDDSNP